MQKFKRTKYTCFYSYLAMASAFSLPPMLFMTFHEMYGISYTLLGSLLLVNFCTQLIIDMIFTFFSSHFNIKTTIRIMPLITSAGLLVYSLVPAFFPEKALFGLIAGTVIFSVAAGLCEVLLSPLVAALPSDNPEKDMSLLHSLYGWGVVTVVLISSLFFKLFGTENWMYLAVFWSILPLFSSLLFFISPIPDMNLNEGTETGKKSGRGLGIFLCAVCIFLGSGAENTMTGWISGFMEKALNVPKTAGDILGMAMFALLLAFTRTVYAKFGKNIVKTLFISMCGAAVCYIAAGCSVHIIPSFIACVVTGIFTSMLWPGTLIMMEEKIVSPGVAAYALMAACGDLGASFAPQLTGIIIDKFSASSLAADLAGRYSISTDEIGLKVGMLCAAVLPILGAIWMLIIMKKMPDKKSGKQESE